MAEEGTEIDKNAYDVFTVSGDSLKLELPSGADPSQGEILPGLEWRLPGLPGTHPAVRRHHAYLRGDELFLAPVPLQ